MTLKNQPRWLAGMVGAIISMITVALFWRWASRHRQLPCPAWLSWWLENPLADWIGGTQRTLDHIGLRPGERGLDVGSGPGRLAIPAAQRVGPAGSIVALDIQPKMLARLQQRAAQAGIKNITPQLSDIATETSLPAESFDRAWLVTVLGEIPDRAAALRNLYRLLKPGGTLSITEILGDPHYQSRQTVLDLGQAAGFEPGQSWHSGLAFIQNFRKP